MKKYVLSIALVCISLISYGQSNYEKVMSEKIAKLEMCKTTEDYQMLANDFERIGKKETTQWLPSYYAAFAQIQKGRIQMRDGKMEGLSAYSEAAFKYLDQAESSAGKDNAEIHLLKKMAYSLSMMENPQQKYMTDGVKAAEELKIAEQLDSNNPRIALIKAEDMYFTPEQYGGSKTKGIELFKEALNKFNTYKPKSSIDPSWGRGEAEYFISQAGK
ncbi:hypothetical protein [Chryseobacterium potabilaquae]|uniref:Tetratricopeptide repeat-containing protein n=1 Tax=Chryseobacterium potabilaquae TaxID=2675057 RepID=A0A6N4X4Z6_9FLAO|nr:hypothetical protein [Chryseobacterium potabilaquae]CAA7195138.1 hypothetical protein CHRY9293_01383 [Chryseobacterium potabilaquae]